MTGREPPAPILTVEDADLDFELLERAALKLGLGPSLVRRTNIHEAAGFLHERLENGALLPALVILDLRLRDGDGEELLQELKHHPGLRPIPVVVWSGCIEPEVIDRCYREGASGFVRKTADRETTARSLVNLFRFWFEAVSLPSPV